eukprot:768420-Hanusia_phi.AAC.3
MPVRRSDEGGRFSTRAHRREQAFRGADGVLGLAFSSQPNSASVLKSLSEEERKAWHVEEPKNFRRMTRKMFTIVAGEEEGELQMDGYDDAATQDGAVAFLEVADSSGYSVVIREIRYGKHLILSSSSPGGAGAGGNTEAPRAEQLLGAFDTGSSCIELPDSAVAGLSVCNQEGERRKEMLWREAGRGRRCRGIEREGGNDVVMKRRRRRRRK